MDVSPFDALLYVSFGGPEKPDDVVPFLENVTAGRGIPRERLEEVGEHYFLFGGKSPINDLNREVIEAVRGDLAGAGIDLPVYWGNRNWDPYLADTMRQMVDDGVKNAAFLVTSAYSSYSGCRQYREDLAGAVEGLDLQLTRLRLYFNHPGFVQPFVEGTAEALAGAPEGTRVAYVTHSIPDAMNDSSGGPDVGAYRRQHEEVARLVTEAVGIAPELTALVYCSRSGSPRTPWLEPDVNDHLEQLAADGAPGVVVVPIGFVSDHMEVVYDLDTEAKETAERLGLWFRRVATPGTHPEFVAMVRDLLLERSSAVRGDDPQRATVGRCAPNPDVCPIDCCANLRGPKPAVR
ncbi:ferrochelatase [Aeromicrobium sp. Root495]|uniref:ferrochelatase n=1 Tax=Aeromicrobium sp. Root495 TaxID=1736550 RepID=UPI0006FE4131|nr:ferrochelatase [Aeromicrobium sp. Root495]KQY59438.1 ferrochelatase [Aeromicrobium sp. Root495]